MSSGSSRKSVMQHFFTMCTTIIYILWVLMLALPWSYQKFSTESFQTRTRTHSHTCCKWSWNDLMTEALRGCSGLVMPSWFTTIVLLHEIIRQLFRYMSIKSLRTRLYSRFLDVCSRRCLTNPLSAQPPPVLFWFTPNNIFEEVPIRRHCLQFKLNMVVPSAVGS